MLGKLPFPIENWWHVSLYIHVSFEWSILFHRNIVEAIFGLTKEVLLGLQLNQMKVIRTVLNLLGWQIPDQFRGRWQIIHCNSKMYSHVSSLFHLDQKRQYLLLKGLRIYFLNNRSWTMIFIDLLLFCYFCRDLQRFKILLK